MPNYLKISTCLGRDEKKLEIGSNLALGRFPFVQCFNLCCIHHGIFKFMHLLIAMLMHCI